RDQVPRSGYGRPERATCISGTVQVPNCCLAGVNIKKNVIGVTIAIHISRGSQYPAVRQSRPRRGTHICAAREVPDGALPCGWTEEQVIWVLIGIKISFDRNLRGCAVEMLGAGNVVGGERFTIANNRVHDRI